MTMKRDVREYSGARLLMCWAAKVRASEDWQRFAIALVSGAVSVLSLAPFFLWPVLFITLPNLVWLLDHSGQDHSGRGQSKFQSARSAALIGWLFGFGYFSAGLFWVGEAFLVQADIFVWALPFAVTLLPAGLALFFAAATGVARLFWVPGISRILVLAVALTATEWLRGHILTGFPWNIFGYALTYPLPLMQLASLFGVYGLTAWTVALCAAPAVTAVDSLERNQLNWRCFQGTAATAILLSIFWIYGTLRLSAFEEAFVDGVKIRVVQVSVPQREKWIPGNQERIFADHLRMSGQNASGVSDNLADITHVIWPEVAMPFLPLETPAALQRIGAMLPPGRYLLSGALRRDPPAAQTSLGAAATGSKRRRAFNSMFVFDSDGRAADIYDKIHLVPFGEYLPWQSTLEAIGLRQLSRLRGGFSSGVEPRPLLNMGSMTAVAGLICYEAIFPGDVLPGTEDQDRPNLFINITNDGWFGNTIGPRQHFQQARVRTVETGIPLLRVANNGISAMIGPAGRSLHRLELNKRGTFDTRVPKPHPVPLYGRFGDWILIALLALMLGIALVFATLRSKP